jgi:serine/threonine protein kinase
VIWIADAVLGHVRDVVDEPDLSATKYRLIRPLGRGGMGAVWAVEDTELGRQVALKVSAGGELRDEARVLARLEHPGIVPVHDVGMLPDGRVFYAMKLVRGERLDAWAKEARERRGVLALFQRICEAVAFAHAHGVVHRDLKPGNVMVGAFGEALVLDWGIAASERATPLAAGTPGYMAPEQARGGVIDARTDVYGLGGILTFLLRAGGDVPPRLMSICAKATAEAPEGRYATASDLSDDVGRFLDALPVRAHREGIFERAGRFASRHRVVLSLLAAYLFVRFLIGFLLR